MGKSGTLLPSPDALKLHYRRACWVIAYWKQSSSNNMHYFAITSYGWKKDTTLQVVWDSDENLKSIRDRVTFLMRGCQCKRSRCKTKQCTCAKQNKECGPGCSCFDCHNGQGKTLLHHKPHTNLSVFISKLIQAVAPRQA